MLKHEIEAKLTQAAARTQTGHVAVPVEWLRALFGAPVDTIEAEPEPKAEAANEPEPKAEPANAEPSKPKRRRRT